MRASIRGSELFYLTYGRGLPILLMHGGPGLDHTYMRPWVDGLADAAELIYFDHRGNGRSAGRTELSDVTLDTWVEDADALREHLGHERVVVFGHAWGGFVAQHYAHRFAEHVAGLVLCDATPALDYPQVMMANAQEHCTPQQMGALLSLLARPLVDDMALRRAWNTILPVYFYRHDPKIAAAMDEVMAYSATAYNHGLFTLATSLNTLSILPQIKAPTLIMAGRHDWWMPLAQGAERLKQGIRGAELAIFEESGHFPFIEEPVAFCNVVRHFLRNLRRP